MRRTLLCLGFGLGLAVFFWALPKGNEPLPDPVVENAAARAAATTRSKTPNPLSRVPDPLERAAASAPPLGIETRSEGPRAPAPGPLPPSLHGTEVDGELVTDAGGRLFVTRETRAFFDYFLAASGEESPELLKARIVEAIQARLPAPAAAEGVSLLERYLLYRERARAISTRDPEIRLRHLRDLRREVFGPSAAEALFGEEEKLDAFALGAAASALPPDARRARAETTAPLRLLQSERALDKDGVTGEERRKERERRWGEAVADRLETLEAARAEWMRRLRDFREARAALLQDESLAPEERSSAIAAILARDFTPQERLRVLALGRIEKED